MNQESMQQQTQTDIIQELTHLLEIHTAIDQDALLIQIDAPNNDILDVLHELMEDGKIAYNIDWDIDGRGKQYTTGLIQSTTPP